MEDIISKLGLISTSGQQYVEFTPETANFFPFIHLVMMASVTMIV